MTEKQLIRKLEKTCHVLIYGAGMVGELVFQRLSANGLEDRILGFAVSRQGKQDCYQGFPVKSIGEWSNDGNTVVIIATLKNFHEEISDILQEHSYANIIKIDDSLFRSMGQAYIREFLVKNVPIENKIDIAVMASDNNSASGAFLCMMDLNLELNKNGISTVVILPGYGDGERLLQEKGIVYTYIPSEDWLIGTTDKAYIRKAWRIVGNWRAIRKLCKFYREHGIKLIHNNTTYTYVGAVAAYRLKLPVVWHLRENISDQGFRFFCGVWARRLLNRSARLIYISKRMALCRAELDEKIAQVIYDGVDVDAFYSDHEILNSLSEIRILLPGRVTAYKGQRDFFEAAGIIRERTDLRLRIDLIGKEDAEYRKELEELAKEKNFEEWVHFHGMQSDVAGFYSRSDITVVCSAVEAFGRVTVEAQLAGCLVIGADAGATPELIQQRKTGLLYPKSDTGELAEQIIWAIEHLEEVQKIAKAGQEYARGLYSKERNVQEIMNVYEEILGKDWKEN